MYEQGTIDMTQCMIMAASRDEQERLEKMFSVYGFDLSAPANANEALEQFEKDLPDVIVLPQDMRDMDVMGFIRRVRRRASGTETAVFLCAQTPDSETVGQAIWQGASDFLFEPYDAEVLDRKLKQAGVV